MPSIPTSGAMPPGMKPCATTSTSTIGGAILFRICPAIGPMS
ncbi:MAG: hypothetical protein H6563_07850 [Lewinellaceae bacterium]|nr:hypothetical protein [Lewinellaceae bacterium]